MLMLTLSAASQSPGGAASLTYVEALGDMFIPEKSQQAAKKLFLRQNGRLFDYFAN